MPNKISYVYADGERINQVINNLIDNAIRYTKNGGNITIRVKQNKYKVVVEIINSDLRLKEK
jgi:signal transduction histidine kinase